MIHILKNKLSKGIATTPIDVQSSNAAASEAAIESIGKELKGLIQKRFARSFHIREVDTGSCGACESEIIAATNPFYDVQRFGINFVASPRHADALLVTGPVSKNMVLALKKTFDAMPQPKIVITLGDCAFDGGVFKGSYYIEGGVKAILPVNLHIPGCPPTPRDIICALLRFLRPPKK